MARWQPGARDRLVLAAVDLFADQGYVETARISTMDRASALGQVPWHMRLLGRLMPTLRSGYSIRAFKPR